MAGSQSASARLRACEKSGRDRRGGQSGVGVGCVSGFRDLVQPAQAAEQAPTDERRGRAADDQCRSAADRSGPAHDGVVGQRSREDECRPSHQSEEPAIPGPTALGPQERVQLVQLNSPAVAAPFPASYLEVGHSFCSPDSHRADTVLDGKAMDFPPPHCGHAGGLPWIGGYSTLDDY